MQFREPARFEPAHEKKKKERGALSIGHDVGRLPGEGDTNMNYVLMIHAAESRFATMSPAQGEAMMQSYGAYTKDLFGTGRAGDCAALEDTRTATSVRIRDGKRTVQDGPFAETREQLGGYYAFDGSEEEALSWASKIPDAKGGTIEVRPVFPTNKPAGPQADPKKDQKEYLLLIYEAESVWGALSQADQEKQFAGYRAFTQGLREAGQYIAGERLDGVKSAKCVSVSNAKRVVRDGPFAETREQLGGYYRVFARNLDDAIEHASKIPAVHLGTIEIRPIMDTSKYA
jgi:hypothetical protein